MRRLCASLAALWILAAALPCLAEDRTERIEGPKGWKELDYRSGRLAEERSFDAEGALIAERDFGPDSLPAIEKKYLRSGGRLEAVEARDLSGAVVGRMSYRYDREGRLLATRSEGSFGDEATGVISSPGRVQASWQESEGEASVAVYDGAGRRVLSQDMKAGAAVRAERRTYGASGKPSKVQVEDKADGSFTETSYDADGRESLRKSRDGKGVQAVTSYSYDAEGRVVGESTVSGGHSLEVRTAYSKGGAVARVETRRDGSLVLAVEYAASGDGRTEELYEDGELFAKSFYEGGRRVKDSFYSGGALVRSREYQ